jgi:hypothetical protein
MEDMFFVAPAEISVLKNVWTNITMIKLNIKEN